MKIRIIVKFVISKFVIKRVDCTPKRVNVKTIVALSEKGAKNRVFDEFCMLLWEYEELLACRNKNYQYLPVNVLNELFHIVDGIPRYVLKISERILNMEYLLESDVDSAKEEAMF